MAVQSTHIINKLAFAVNVDKFTVNSDVDVKLGGDSGAPDPHQYLQVALASCTAITVTMYAKRKNIPLVDINVGVVITAEGEVNTISRTIQLIGDLTQEQKDSLMVIADKCPIHKFLTRGAQITTTVKEA